MRSLPRPSRGRNALRPKPADLGAQRRFQNTVGMLQYARRRIVIWRLAVDVTLTIPDDLATRLRTVENWLPEILELGLREWLSAPPGYVGMNDVFETLARLPTPEEVLALRPSTVLQTRIEELLVKARDGSLSSAELREWEHYEYVEHLVRLAKAQVLQRRARQ